MRRRRLLGAAFLAVALLAVPGAAPASACGGLLSSLLGNQCYQRPVAPDPGGSEAPDQPVPAEGKGFGFNAALFIAGQATVDQELDLAKAAGANMYRVPLTWRVMQPQQGDPPLPPAAPGNMVERFDIFYAEALERGITPIFIPHWAPLWATRYSSCGVLDLGCHSIARSEHKLVPDRPHLDEYEEFVRAVKARWPQAVIEPWNTPNLYWKDPDYRGSRDFSASPEHFADIQCAAYRGSKSVNDDPVLAAGWGARGYAEYVRRVYQAGGHHCWDIGNLHVYPGDQTRFDADSILAEVFQDARRLRDANDDHDPFWVTETGYATTGPRSVTTEVQADAARRLYNRLVTMPDVDAVIFHTMRDSPFPFRPHNDPSRSEYGHGFLREDWKPKPVYCYFVGQAGNQAGGC